MMERSRERSPLFLNEPVVGARVRGPCEKGLVRTKERRGEKRTNNEREERGGGTAKKKRVRAKLRSGNRKPRLRRGSARLGAEKRHKRVNRRLGTETP